MTPDEGETTLDNEEQKYSCFVNIARNIYSNYVIW